MTKGYVIDIQDFSVNDGDGIRTTLFFAGCPLRCAWCANPEEFTTMNKVMHVEKTCIACGRCTAVCPRHVGIQLNRREERAKCNNCGNCVPVCPTKSRQNMIFEYSPKEIYDKTKKYFNFFRQSNGGITFSGGECTLQLEFLTTLTNLYYDANIHLAMESSGYFDFGKLEDILRKMDTLFIDIKSMDNKKHKYYTGKSNDLVLENIQRIGAFHQDLIIRIPVIKTVNADAENIRQTTKFVKNYVKQPKIELLPYHTLGDLKYTTLNITKPSEMFQTPTQEELQSLKQIVRDQGVEVVSYR